MLAETPSSSAIEINPVHVTNVEDANSQVMFILFDPCIAYQSKAILAKLVL
jgi:hypothetical protein